MALYPGVILASNPAAYYQFNEVPGSSAYLDATANNRDIARSSEDDPNNPALGLGTWTYYAHYGTSPLVLSYAPTGLIEFSMEVWFRATTPDKYVILDSYSTTTDLEAHAEISEDALNPGDYLIKFGLGYGEWDIELADTHVHSFIYSQDVSQIFDGNWHQIVVVWGGAAATPLDDTQLAVYLDGQDVTDAGTGDTFLGTMGNAPYNLSSFYLTGPYNDVNSNAAYYDELSLYTLALSASDVVEHFNAAATIEPVYETDTATELIPWTDGMLLTAYELDTANALTRQTPSITIESTSTVNVGYTTFDMLEGRLELDSSGSTSVDLSAATLQSGEPNAAGYTKTVWFELDISPEEILEERIQLTSPTSTGKVSVYKDLTLDDADDGEESDEEQLQELDPAEAQPVFSSMTLVQTAAADQRFTLDEDYGSPYFLQVGLLTGTGDDFTLTWGDASPGPGGSFDLAVPATGKVGLDYLNTSNAWLETGEPNSTGITETRSVWLNWTAPDVVDASTTFTINSSSSGSAFAAEIYTGTAVNALSQQTSGLAAAGESLQLSINASVGVDYYLRIASATDDETFSVLWAGPKLEYPANDPAQHIVVTVHAGVAGATVGGAAYTANERITELPNRKGLQFQESLNIPGSGSLTIKQDDPILRAYNPTDWPFETDDPWTGTTQETWRDDPFQLLGFGNIVKFWMNKKVSEGVYSLVCVHAFIIRNREANVVGTGEASDLTLTVSGPSVHALLADFMVVHDNYPDSRKSEMRAFNWASVAVAEDKWSNGGWFDSTGSHTTKGNRSWNHPVNANGIRNPPGYKKKKSEAASKRPKYALYTSKKPKWPDLNAKWLWISANKSNNQDTSFPSKKTPPFRGLHYYRTKNLYVKRGGRRLRMSAHSDTYYEIWLDGVMFMSGNGNENYSKFKSKKLTLDRGYHTIAVYVEDRKTNGSNKKPKDYDHNDAFIMTLQNINRKGKVKRTWLRTNKLRWYSWHGPNPPAWGRAAVLRKVIREAQARGVHSAQALTLASDFGQKSAEGNWWFDVKERSMEVQVGTSVMDLAAQFSESNRFDVWIDPDTLQLYAFQGGNNGAVPRGVDRSNNVALVPGYNLLNYTVQENDEVKNSLLVQYERGFIYVKSDQATANRESIQKYGIREGYIELGDYRSPDTAEAVAKAILAMTADADVGGGSSDIVGHLQEDYAGSLVAAPGAVPFLDFTVGDTISAPSSNGVLHPHRVLSLSCTEDDNGNLTFDPEIQGGTSG